MTHNSHNNEPKSKCCEAERTYVTQKYHSGACSECDKPFVPDYEKECSACGIDHNPNTSKCFDETKRKPIKLHKKCGCELDMECEDCFTDTAKIVTITTPTEGLDWREKFDEKFPAMGYANKEIDAIYRYDQYVNNESGIKQFISTLIEEARHQGKKEGYEKGIRETGTEVRKRIETLPIIDTYLVKNGIANTICKEELLGALFSDEQDKFR